MLAARVNDNLPWMNHTALNAAMDVLTDESTAVAVGIFVLNLLVKLDTLAHNTDPKAKS
jgi:hypothetical protein